MKLFITGIGTDVGKTIASSIIVEALEADYWKPIQAGDLDNSDTNKVEKYVSNPTTKFHKNAYALQTPASPHLAAEIDGIKIELSKISEPTTTNHLVIEGAGGIYVPLNNSDCVIDLIQPDYKVIVVSRHYLGSINHTLMTIEILKSRNLNVAGIVFSGNENKATESIILEKTNVPMIGRIDSEPYFDQNVIKYYADLFYDNLINL
jgi:dethiobiotin synthetase